MDSNGEPFEVFSLLDLAAAAIIRLSWRTGDAGLDATRKQLMSLNESDDPSCVPLPTGLSSLLATIAVLSNAEDDFDQRSSNKVVVE